MDFIDGMDYYRLNINISSEGNKNLGSYGIWSDGSYERRRHSIGLVLIHDTHHDVNVEL